MKPTLYLLPGLLCDRTVWEPQIAHFAEKADVRTPDYGDADRITKMAEIALEGAPARFSLAGHSMGARVALEVYRLAPERIERLALLDTGVHGIKDGEREKRMTLVNLAHEKGMEALCDAWLPPMVHPDRREDAAFMAPLRAMVLRSNPARFKAQIEALLHRPDTAPVLTSIDCPLLAGVGRQDEWSPVAQHEEILSEAGHGELAIFEDAGHMAPCEAPDAVNAALEAWLNAKE